MADTDSPDQLCIGGRNRHVIPKALRRPVFHAEAMAPGIGAVEDPEQRRRSE
ncbi:MAG TPA: hypothetical protein VF092_13325 [Longimicrobium sp.]